MESGDLIDLAVTGVAHGGVFVGRHDGRVVFAPDAIPGETVRVRLTEVGKASFWRGETIEILDASARRRPHVWAAADVDRAPEERPGGADFGHIELAYQRELKHQVLTDALARIGRIDVPSSMSPADAATAADAATPADAASPAATTDGTRWRTRLSLHVDADGRVGPFAARSHRVVPVGEHPLATAVIEEAALGLAGSPGRIDLVEPADGRVRVIARPAAARREHRGRHRGRPLARSAARRPATPPDVVTEVVGAREFRVDAAGFWQVHFSAAPTLTRIVTEELAAVGGIDPEASHLDLFGGVGLFAAALGDLGGAATRVTTVESDARATEHAGGNLAEWVGARAVTDRVDRFLDRLDAEASARERERLAQGVVLLDPPRAGAGRAVVEGVARLAPAAIVYVACDPVALARDLGTFSALGYRTTRPVRGVDLFPHSHHLEAVALLTRDAPR